MRLLALLALVALMAGCTQPDEPSTNGADDGDVATDGTPTDGAGDAPSNSTGGDNGFCGPPQCSPCPPQTYLYASMQDEGTAGIVLLWDDAPAANQTAFMGELLDAAWSSQFEEREGEDATLRAEMRHLYDALRAQDPAQDPNAEGNYPSILVEHRDATFAVGVSQVVC